MLGGEEIAYRLQCSLCRLLGSVDFLLKYNTSVLHCKIILITSMLVSSKLCVCSVSVNSVADARQDR